MNHFVKVYRQKNQQVHEVARYEGEEDDYDYSNSYNDYESCSALQREEFEIARLGCYACNPAMR